MSAPRVFISSTFYDLKQVRNIIGNFIRDIGYEPVMHEHSDVAYTQNAPLENDCYTELSSCDIVVCIIGNHFGSQSSSNDLSITMNEIRHAIKTQKKVYIFVANDVYIENRTYLRNKDSGSFAPAYTDDLRIHEFLANLQTTVTDHVISPFDTTDQIVETLKKQFAGLLQGFLQREASLTEGKTIYDLQEIVNQIKQSIAEYESQKVEFFQKFDSSLFSCNGALIVIKKLLGLSKSSFFAKDVDALDELMEAFGFIKSDFSDTPFDCIRCYEKTDGSIKKKMSIKNAVVNQDGSFRDIRSRAEVEQNILWEETEDLPF
ncbi:DUF4062 domain-containing protein [Candidatus Saccharibacteria bacterium]|nr:DUF4062 domain-containing protein [Candidatus Saccharibacteria bacterium]